MPLTGRDIKVWFCVSIEKVLLASLRDPLFAQVDNIDPRFVRPVPVASACVFSARKIFSVKKIRMARTFVDDVERDDEN